MKRIETSLTRRNRTKFLNKTLFERREKERLKSGFLEIEYENKIKLIKRRGKLKVKNEENDFIYNY